MLPSTYIAGFDAVVARLRVVDRHAPEVAPLDALAQALHREQVGMRLDQAPHLLDQLGVVVEPVERNRDLRGREDGVRSQPYVVPTERRDDSDQG